MDNHACFLIVAIVPIVIVVLLNQIFDLFVASSIAVACCFLWTWWRSEHRLVLSYYSAGDAVEKQLVEASFRIANCFASCPSIYAVLKRVGVSAKILRKNKITVKFLNPVESFAKDCDQYAYSWIDPDLFDLYTVMVDSAILKRYRTLSSMHGLAVAAEMNWIELFVAIKLLHELAHLGFRWTYPDLLVNSMTPPNINEGETGNHFERLAFGGVAGFAFQGKKPEWDGSQKFLCILLDGFRVRTKYMESVCAECRRALPNLTELVPAVVVGRPFCGKRDEHITPSPCKPSRAEIDALNALPHTIDVGDDCYVIPAFRCGIRYRRAQPRALDFDGAVAAGRLP